MLNTQNVLIGRCIYCGANRGDLSDEHVIPYGLSSDWKLRDASCGACAKQTSEFERRVLREMLFGIRTVKALKTRRPKKRPTTLPLDIAGNDGAYSEVQLSADIHPGLSVFPIFDAPGVLSGRPNDGLIHYRGWGSIGSGGNSPEDVAAAFGVEKFRSKPILADLSAFARMIAKIGYCAAVARWGYDGIADRFVLPAILGRSDDVGFWIGNLDSPPVNPTTDLHSVTTRVAVNTVRVHVRLFALVGAPEYVAVVGTLKNSLETLTARETTPAP